jgi:hypothetical protein
LRYFRYRKGEILTPSSYFPQMSLLVGLP